MDGWKYSMGGRYRMLLHISAIYWIGVVEWANECAGVFAVACGVAARRVCWRSRKGQWLTIGGLLLHGEVLLYAADH
jgi:hypothetical protein